MSHFPSAAELGANSFYFEKWATHFTFDQVMNPNESNEYWTSKCTQWKNVESVQLLVYKNKNKENRKEKKTQNNFYSQPNYSCCSKELI